MKLKHNLTTQELLERLYERVGVLEETIEFLTKDLEQCEGCGGFDISEEAQQLTDVPTCQSCVDRGAGR